MKMIEMLLVGRILYGFKILHDNVDNICTIESGKVRPPMIASFH